MEIRIDQVNVGYQGSDFELQVPSLTMPRGSQTALVGPSGCGKTTLLRLIAGIQLPLDGTIHVGSTMISKLAEAKRREFRITSIGFIFQDFQLIDYLNVRENILLPYRLHPDLKRNHGTEERLASLVAALGLQKKLTEPIHHLSHGEKQRVAIGRALVTEPGLILADEPTGNLDPRSKDQILQLLLDQVSAQRTTLVMVTHDYDRLDSFDQVIRVESFHPAEAS